MTQSCGGMKSTLCRPLLWTLPILLAAGVGAARAGTPILDLATERAVSYDDASLRWTCDETSRRVSYHEGGPSSESAGTDYALLLVPDVTEHHAVEQIAPRGAPGHPLARAPVELRGFPPVTSWLRLFHPDTRPWMLIEDLVSPHPDALEHAFAFRGAGSFGSGDDLREWEGTAWVDSVTGDLLRIAAIPTRQGERLAKRIERRNKWAIAIDLFHFRFNVGPKAHGRRLEIAFGPQADKFWLPTAARLEEFDAVSQRDERPLRATLLSIERCREFEARAAPGRAANGSDPKVPR